MVTRALVALGAVLVTALAISPATALAASSTASLGPVRATLTWDEPADYEFANIELSIMRGDALERSGAVRVPDCEEPYCQPTTMTNSNNGPRVTVRNLDGRGAPEVVLTFFSGGAHCCTIVQVHSLRGCVWRVTNQNFGSNGAKLINPERDQVVEFATRDKRFEYQFSSYASSWKPVQLLRWRAPGSFVDVSRAYPRFLRNDATQALAAARRSCRSDNTGLWAGWMANRYRLGLRTAAIRTIRAQAAAGCLAHANGAPVPVDLYIRQVDQFLQGLPAYRSR